MSDSVLVDITNGIMTITMNRPEARNAINGDTARGIAAALDQLDQDDSVRVGILTGAGGTFCSGMDLKGFLTGDLPSVEGRGFGGLTEALPRKPLIGAIEGYALAGGCEMALSCDMLVASETSKFGIPEAKRGLVAAAGGLIRLPRQIPQKIAMELALTGDFMSAQRAADLGLVNRVVAEGNALESAKELAAAINANGPLAVAVSKQIVLQSADWSTSDMFSKQNDIAMPVFSSEDAIEGAAAFAEKRAPNWKGK